MDLTTYINRLRQEAAATTALADDQVRETMERLLLALDPATRLVLIEALSDAAAEISADLPRGSVDTRLRGSDVEFIIEGLSPDHLEEDAPASPTDVPDPVEDAEDGDLTRITLRLPSGLKARAEDLAQTGGISLNSWLIDAVRTAVRPVPTPPVPPAIGRVPTVRSQRRMTGWA